MMRYFDAGFFTFGWIVGRWVFICVDASILSEPLYVTNSWCILVTYGRLLDELSANWERWDDNFFLDVFGMIFFHLF